jgi:N-acetylneuraminate synthase
MSDTWLHSPGDTAPCTIIAEVGQAHDGSLGIAHAFVDAATAAGADAIKFQTHLADAESTPDEPWRKPFSSQDKTRWDYWKRMEFEESQWVELKDHAHEKGMLFLSSPFSLKAVELLERVGVAGWKVASGETNNHALIDAMAATGRPVMVSTGMSLLSEIDAAVERVRGKDAPVAVLQCTSAYPCPPELLGLNMIGEFRERYGCAVGLSEHSGTIYPSLAAAAYGIQLLEVHVTLSKDMFGPDVPSSVTPAELRTIVDGVRFIETMNAHPVSKDNMPESVSSLRAIFTKSVVATTDLERGTVLESAHLTSKKPGSGIPANDLPSLIGRTLARDVARDKLLSHEDLEGTAS